MVTVLVTGGTGKTGRRLVDRLRKRGAFARVASRSGEAKDGGEAVRFDWADPETYGGALQGADAAYLVAPSGEMDMLDSMRPFLDAGIRAGVRRYVLLSASALPEGGPLMGAVHAWLRAHAPEWAVLRPSWFMQNFSEQQHLATVRDEDAIYTAAGDGRVAFIDAGDIAEAAASALLAAETPLRGFILTGPRAIGYDQAAAIISQAIGRKVRHVRLSQVDLARRWVAQMGLPPVYAEMLAAMDGDVAGGAEDRVTGDFGQLTGLEPTSFERFAAGNAGCWAR